MGSEAEDLPALGHVREAALIASHRRQEVSDACHTSCLQLNPAESLTIPLPVSGQISHPRLRVWQTAG
jgi:hypothetical protein